MARFDVYRHPDEVMRPHTPYLLDVQNNYIDSLNTRVVMPLRNPDRFGPPMRDLNPAFVIDGVAVVLDASAIAAFPAQGLRTPVVGLQSQSERIVQAMDMLFGAY